MHVEGGTLVYDAVTCAACGAKIREDRPRCFRCGEPLLPAAEPRVQLPLGTFALVVGSLAVVGAIATMSGPSPARAEEPVAPVQEESVATTGEVEVAVPDPLANPTHVQDAEALNNQGQVLVRSGRAGDAIEYFDRAIALAGERWAYHFNRAKAHADLRDWPKAIDGYREALRLFPEDYATQFNLARALDAAARPEEAVASYRRYLELNPDDAQAEKIKARISVLEGAAAVP
jgi:cytochrome c-type biogenesis protein CcmH/NrfG